MSIIIDVRENDEFKAEHIEKSISVPLSNFATIAPGILENLKDNKITLMCQSGMRAQMAKSAIHELGFSEKFALEIFEGGLNNWKDQSLPLVKTQAARLSLMRQVQLIAGLIIIFFGAMTYLANINFVFGALFVGCGLTLAGATGFCGMAKLLALAPWNR